MKKMDNGRLGYREENPKILAIWQVLSVASSGRSRRMETSCVKGKGRIRKRKRERRSREDQTERRVREHRHTLITPKDNIKIMRLSSESIDVIKVY